AGETPQALSAEEAPRTARGKRSAWSGNQQTNLTQSKFKGLFQCPPLKVSFFRADRRGTIQSKNVI
ncbi:hypothetical protein V7152_16830, partial [Neobacillus drentensis]